MDAADQIQPADAQAASNNSSTASESAKEIGTKSTVKVRNLRFLGASLVGVIALISLVAIIMLRHPKNSQSEVKQKEYNEEFNSLTPSTAQVNPSQDERETLDSITIDELDTEFNAVDKDLKNL